MASIIQIPVALTGFEGAPGYNTWHFTSGDIGTIPADVQTAAEELYAFYDTCRSLLRSQMKVTFPGEAKILTIDTGDLESLVNYDLTNDTVTSSGTNGVISRATMIKVKLRTDTVVRNRILQGGIYFGPLSEQGCDNSGNVSAVGRNTIIGALQGSFTGLGPKLQVWSRPDPRKGYPGVAGDVTAVNVKTSLAVLRSRRD